MVAYIISRYRWKCPSCAFFLVSIKVIEIDRSVRCQRRLGERERFENTIEDEERVRRTRGDARERRDAARPAFQCEAQPNETDTKGDYAEEVARLSQAAHPLFVSPPPQLMDAGIKCGHLDDSTLIAQQPNRAIPKPDNDQDSGE